MTGFREINFKYPRKKKKKLKKLGKWPQKGFILEINNNVVADVKTVIFGYPKEQ